MSGSSEDEVIGISTVVVDRMRGELGGRADEVLDCLRTAAVLSEQAQTDQLGLRLAASALYNLREALNRVVEGQDPAEGGLPAVLKAWHAFEAQTAAVGSNIDAAREQLHLVLGEVAADEDRAYSYARRLLAHLRDRAGVDPRRGLGDLVAQYGELRDQTNRAVHSGASATEASSLLERSITWFVRMFSPPDEVADAISLLALQSWRGNEQIKALAKLVTNDHHLRLFFGELRDPEWLVPLYEAGLAQVSPSSSWPVAALIGGLGESAPDHVATLLGLLLPDTANSNTDSQAQARLDILRVATRLGPPGYRIIAEIARLQSDAPIILSMTVHAACEAEATDHLVLDVADAVLNHCADFSNGNLHDAGAILDQLLAGVTEDNVIDRARVVAGKSRRLARAAGARHVGLGVEALSSELDEHPQPLLLFAHYLARFIAKAHELNVVTSEQLSWVETMPGEVGDRMRARVLAQSADVELSVQVDHIAARLGHALTTAEDLLLVRAILARSPSMDDLRPWSDSIGTPTPADDNGEIPDDWRRAWRWAALLPDNVMTAWTEIISLLSEQLGEPNNEPLTADRKIRWRFEYGISPYRVHDLSGRPAAEVANLVASWKPDAEDSPHLHGTLELARALEDTVKADAVQWSSSPRDIVDILRTPLYIEHYFRGLTAQVTDILANASAVAAVVATQSAAITTAVFQPTLLEDPTGDLLRAILDLISALANRDTEIDDVLDEFWRLCLDLISNAPAIDDEVEHPLERAINCSWGQSFQAMLALASWEYRKSGAVRAEFEQTLTAVIRTTTTTGLIFRSLLARHRPLLETIAADWLEAQAIPLFKQGPFAQRTFDLTLRWVFPTPWLYRTLATELYDAAGRSAHNAARFIALAALHRVPGYELGTVIRRLERHPAALAEIFEDTVFLIQQREQNTPAVDIAVQFWDDLLNADRDSVPARTLTGMGRWAFVTDIDDNLWVNLVSRTLETTNGAILYPTYVAERVARVPPTETSRRILLRLLSNSNSLENREYWERSEIGKNAIQVLRASANQPADQSFHALRTRLIDLGFLDARNIHPSGGGA